MSLGNRSWECSTRVDKRDSSIQWGVLLGYWPRAITKYICLHCATRIGNDKDGCHEDVSQTSNQTMSRFAIETWLKPASSIPFEMNEPSLILIELFCRQHHHSLYICIQIQILTWPLDEDDCLDHFLSSGGDTGPPPKSTATVCLSGSLTGWCMGVSTFDCTTLAGTTLLGTCSRFTTFSSMVACFDPQTPIAWLTLRNSYNLPA